MNSREAKLRAKEILGENKNNLIIATVLATLVPQIPSFVLTLTGLSLTVPILALIVPLVMLVFQRGWLYSINKTYINHKNGEEFGVFDFFSDGLKNLGRAWSISFGLIPKFIIPILCYIGAAVLGVMSIFSDSLPVGGVLTVVLYIVAFVFMIRATYQYRYADIEAINNPDLTTKEVIQRTGEIMEGNRFRSFKLDLSFFLWAFLVGFVGGLLGAFIPVIGTLIMYYFVAIIQVNLMMAHIVLYDDFSGSSADIVPDYTHNTDVQPDPFNY